MKLLVTGGSGFIGSNFIHRCLNYSKDFTIINLDAMLVGSNPKNLHNINSKNYKFVKGNICDRSLVLKLLKKVDCVINFAAESHVDRSIQNSEKFVNTNILGVHSILESLRKNTNVKFLQVSTDEVYGDIVKGSYKEQDALNPSNPYSATKAAAEMLIKSYLRTYDLNIVTTRCVNNYGPLQFPEKLIPKTILNASKNEKIPIHGKGTAIRQWIHVYDHCDAILQIILKWKNNAVYNIQGKNEETNLSVVKKILKIMNKPETLIKFTEDRPGQDQRYAINSSLIKKEINFQPKINFVDGLTNTVQWYLDNKNRWTSSTLKKITNSTPWLK